MIPESFIQELLARVDIVDVVERYVTLKKAGANYSACCPFHSEKTPSFTVSPSKQFYHCFGCGAHGTAIGFLMQYAGLGFVEAVEDLASHAGLQVPRESGTDAARAATQARKAPLTELMARAARFYRDQLKASPKAIDYLKSRGLTGEVAARFGLGYAPEEWQGLQRVFPDYGDSALLECGLVIDNDQGRRYDRFRDRIMFPILDQRGNVIGFGGRILAGDKGADSGPKYLNSPETPLFEKGRELYGLVQARQAIRERDTVIVVEGYMDVVALAQHGVGNAVATLGTATTPVHVQKLLRQASRIVFCFDGDAAGRKAAWRALEASLEHLTDDRFAGFLFLPPEHDPDSFVRAEGAAAFQALVARPTALSEFMMRELKSHADLGSAEGRAQLVHEAKPLLQRLAAPVLRLQMVKALAGASALAEAEVAAQCGLKPLATGRAPLRRQPRTLEVSQVRTLLRHVLRRPERAARLPLELIDREDRYGALLHAIADALDHGELASGKLALIFEYFRGGPHEPVIGEIAASIDDQADEGAEEQEFSDAVVRVRTKARKDELAELTSRRAALTVEEAKRWEELLAWLKDEASSRERKA
ncbi:MAG: DNA primase [Rhodocyclaceae bacterium]|nr:DNA primase [Rhodocyclaceae bacterium]